MLVRMCPRASAAPASESPLAPNNEGTRMCQSCTALKTKNWNLLPACLLHRSFVCSLVCFFSFLTVVQRLKRKNEKILWRDLQTNILKLAHIHTYIHTGRNEFVRSDGGGSGWAWPVWLVGCVIDEQTWQTLMTDSKLKSCLYVLWCVLSTGR